MVAHDALLMPPTVAVIDGLGVIAAAHLRQQAFLDKPNAFGVLEEQVGEKKGALIPLSSPDVLYMSDADLSPVVWISKLTVPDDDRLALKARHRLGLE